MANMVKNRDTEEYLIVQDKYLNSMEQADFLAEFPSRLSDNLQSLPCDFHYFTTYTSIMSIRMALCHLSHLKLLSDVW